MADIDTNILSNHEYYKSLYPDFQINTETGSVKLYTTVETEYDALINGAAIRDISFKGLIEFFGKDTIDFLHRISTNKILGISPYTSVNTLFTNEKGRIIDRALLLNFDNSQILICSSEFQHKLYVWINKYIIVEEIKTFEVNNKYSLFEVMGSQSDSFLTLIFGKEVDKLGFNEIKKVNIERAEYYCVKVNEYGLVKYLVLSSRADSLSLLRYMHENGSVFDYKMVGEDAHNILRVEKGIPAAPAELNDQYNPHEAGIIKDVSFTKGCYIGQEVIARLETYDKVQRELSWAILDHMPVGTEIPVYHKSGEAGKITSVIYSQALKQPLGLAYIRKEYLVNGNQFSAKDVNGSEFNITIKTLPVTK